MQEIELATQANQAGGGLDEDELDGLADSSLLILGECNNGGGGWGGAREEAAKEKGEEGEELEEG